MVDKYSQNMLLTSRQFEQEKEYWLGKLHGDTVMTEFPKDMQRYTQQANLTTVITHAFPSEIAQKLLGMVNKSDFGLYMLMLSGVKYLLHRYTASSDILVGMPIFKQVKETETLVNKHLVLKSTVKAEATFREWMGEIKETITQANTNQNFPYPLLAEMCQFPDGENGQPFFPTMVMSESIHDRSYLEGVQFHTLFAFSVAQDAITLQLEYRADLYREQIMKQILAHLENYFRAVTTNPGIALSEIELLTEAEKKHIMVDLNQTQAGYPTDKTIHAIFEEQVAKTPIHIAVTCNGETLTYAELNAKANQLARVLRSHGVVPDQLVGLLTERSLDMIVGMIAILKAGGVYVPIDPSYPEDRKAFMLEDSEAQILIAQPDLIDTVAFSGTTINIEDKAIYTGDTSNLAHVNKPEDMAYIIYTSGTTGKPKGVMIEHRNVVRLMMNDKILFDFNENDVWTMFHSFCFDFSVWEMYGALLYGGKVVVVPKVVAQNTKEFRQLLKQEGVTILNQTPTAFYTLINEERLEETHDLSLRYVIFGGEALNPIMLKPYRALYPTTKLINMYGITETTVHVTYKEIGEQEIDTNISNIGGPIPTLTVYIFDQQKKLVPIGVAGEMYVGGDGVARGYWKREELTEERFIQNPYNPSERLYRSGDLAKWLPNAEMEYLGRIDHQVKIRGYRIELGEIETQLLKHDLIKEVVVIDFTEASGQKALCGYFIAEGDISVTELREHIGHDLPTYMIPAYFVRLEKMPSTANGKVDRRALPNPEASGLTSGADYVAPSTATEELLVHIWQQVLDVERIGVIDSFFELGGHSLKAMTLIAHMHEATGVEVPLSELFEQPTIQAIAAYIDDAGEGSYASIQPAPEQASYPVSSAQKRMFILNQIEGAGTTYNMPGVFTVEGPLDFEQFEITFTKLIVRHEALRTSFTTIDGEPVQNVHQAVDFNVAYMEASEEQVPAIVDSFIKPFDLGQAPLLRVTLVKVAEQHHIFLCDLHHIISDGVSMSIIIKEFVELYQGKELAPLRIQYKDFAVWQNDVFASERIQKQEAFWLETFAGELPVLDMPTDFPRPSLQSFEGERFTVSTSKELRDQLHKLSQETGATMYMLLLAAYNVLLAKYSSQEDIIVGSPIAGRPHADVKNVIGMFVNTLALRNQPAGAKTFRSFLAEVKQNALRSFANQDYPFETLVEKLELARDMSRNPLFDTLFTFQNIDVQTGEISELHFAPYATENNISKFDLYIQAIDREDDMAFTIEYCTKLFTRQTMERLAAHLTQILRGIIANPDTTIGELAIITAKETEQILHHFNNTKTEYPRNASIAELFEAEVAKTPDHPAVTFAGKTLTYAELNAKANQVARLLRAKGVTRDQIVGLRVDRSLALIIGMMAILKAGGAYLTLDLDFPEERIKFMLEDSSVKLILTQGSVQDEVPFDAELIDLEDATLYTGDASNLAATIQPTDLAYTIYTSGSTGKPKGVMIEQRNVVRLVMPNNYGNLDASDRLLQTGAIGFDAITYEVFGVLLNGATLHLVNKSVILDPEKLGAYMSEHQITVMWLTAPLFNQLSQDREEMFASVKQLLVGGDALSPKHINAVRSKCPNLTVINGYGPTENTTFSVCYRIERDYNESIPIGYPISNSTAYVVDRYNNLQPIGVPGELVVGGDGVGRGYLNRPELNEAVFIQNPFALGERMYRTGDLTRWLPDGTIEYLGRIDQQVKIRGYRIELGEIETELGKHQAIKEAVVLARTDANGQKYLAAYFIAEADREVTIGELRDHLAKELPSYMIPSAFVQMENLPLTANGKVDRRALPEPETSLATGTEYVAPVGETEEKLVAIWQDVLGLGDQPIGIHDDFFALGGHSLKAMMLLSNVNKACNVDISLRHLFERPTIRGLASCINSADEVAYGTIEPVTARDYYPVSSAQLRMFILNQFDQTSVSYNMPGVMFVEGQVEVEHFKETFQAMINRHETLRTSFDTINGEAVQIVHATVTFTLTYSEASEQEIDQIVRDFVQPFDLKQAPLLRAALVKRSDERHLFLFDMHHIISDGVSIGLFMKEFVQLYHGEELEPLRIQYKDFSVWQNSQFGTALMQKQEAFWLETFAGELPVMNLPMDYARPSVQSLEGDNFTFQADQAVTHALQKLAKETGTTMYMVLLAAFNVLLSTYTSQEDIIVGTPIAGRPHDDVKHLIGMFVNTLAMRNQPTSEQSFRQFLDNVKHNALLAYEHQDYPFETLVDKLNVARDLSRNPLFDILFSVRNMDLQGGDVEGLQFTPYHMESTISKFDISLEASESDEAIFFTLEYCTKLFTKETIERMANHLLLVLAQIVAEPTKQLASFSIMTDAEREQIMLNFNNTTCDYPKEMTLHQVLEAQVAKTPDKVAVLFGEETLTYGELNAKANQLARKLREQGVGRDSIVPLMIERAAEMSIAIMAVLKAGGAYLPISPEFPEDRIEYMLEDSAALVLLTQSFVRTNVTFTGAVLNLDDQTLYTGDDSNLEIINEPTDLAYVIYTSGSTGKPKGTLIEHHSAINRIVWMQKAYPIGETDVILQKTPYTFDVSVWEQFWWSFVGASVVFLVPGGEKEPETIVKAIETYNVTTMHFVPSMLHAFLEHIDREPHVARLGSLRQIFASGEALQLSQATRFNRLLYKAHGTKLINLYGPTEATVDVSDFNCSTGEELTIIPIGKPIDNTQLYIVNKHNQLLPIGVPGELCIAGVQLARGYLNRPDLTAEKFVANPFSLGERMYRTGDLARWMPDGNIEYLGRFDHQVKIRGYRIELGEIETLLLHKAEIKEVVVVAKKDAMGQHYLAAYFVATKPLTIAELREYLAEDLPDYMIPAYFVQLEIMPLSANGKIDRKLLPEPDSSVATGVEYVAPRTETEAKLAEMWTEILGRETIGVHDNFFDIGGHSLKGMILISHIQRQFGTEVPLRVIFNTPTIEALAQFIEQASERASYSAITPVAKQAHYAVSSAQKRMYLLHQLEPQGLTYNMPSVLMIDGPLDTERFQTALAKLVARHETLRTAFTVIDGEPVQKVYDEINLQVGMLSAANEAEAEKLVTSLIRPFNLAEAPLIRAALIKLADDRHIFALDIHHIISDGVSGELIVSEIIEFYQGHDLPALSIQYKDFAAWQNHLFQSEAFTKQEQFWLDTFAGEIPVLDMMTDYPRPSVKSFEGDHVSFTLGNEHFQALQKLTSETGTTLYMVLLAAYNVLLSTYSKQTDIVVGAPIAGRNHADLQPIVGMFVNTLAIRNRPVAEKSFTEFLADVKENALTAFEHQDYPFELLVEKLDIARDLSRNPLFDTMFVLQNMQTVSNEQATSELTLTPFGFDYKVAKLDLTLTASEGPDDIGFMIEFGTKLFKRETIERMAKHFVRIVQTVATNPSVTLGNIALITESEKHQILDVFNNTAQALTPAETTVHWLFEAQVEETPDNIAVSFNGQTLTYRKLNEQANQLARTLRAKGVTADTCVAIMVERSLEMMVGMFAIMKAGGAYVPIDCAYPADRIQYLLEDSGATIALTQPHLLNKATFAGEWLDITATVNYDVDNSNLERINKPSDLAYVIYTSGTTGKPKGVMIEHRNICNSIQWRKEEYTFQHTDVYLLLFSYAFDASVISYLTPMISGASVLLLTDDESKNPIAIAKQMAEQKVTHFGGVQSMLLAVLDCIQVGGLPDLRVSTLGGERLTSKMVEALKAKDIINHELINEYGPTENSVITTIQRHVQDGREITIGVPIANTHIYILGDNNALMPIELPGELCISGNGLARGYLNRQDLTEAAFVANPFVPGAKMYRTGDLARWTANGEIDFLDRIDNQVKVRGYRIELGEIETAVATHDQVKDVVVLVVGEGSEQALCAYIVADEQLSASALRDDLLKQLPAYMVPSYFVKLTHMPLTANGKVDKRALPAPDMNAIVRAEYVAPRTELEAKLAIICQSILGLVQVGIKDNFFEIGGHSLKATLLMAKVYDQLQAELPLQVIFKGPTIEQMAAYITDQLAGGKVKPIVLLNKIGKRNIFAFPPVSGYAIVYEALAEQLGNYSIYGMDFLEETDRIETYIDVICETQLEGPYVLLGYSAGGNLAFEITKAMEAKGLVVSDIIMVDSGKKAHNNQQTLEEIEREVNAMLDEDERYVEFTSNETIKNHVLAKVKSYMIFLNELLHTGTVSANIHLIQEEGKNLAPDHEVAWTTATTGTYTQYDGFGKHSEMLEPPRVRENAQLIQAILK